jgi:hypothetical protein
MDSQLALSFSQAQNFQMFYGLSSSRLTQATRLAFYRHLRIILQVASQNDLSNSYTAVNARRPAGALAR